MACGTELGFRQFFRCRVIHRSVFSYMPSVRASNLVCLEITIGASKFTNFRGARNQPETRLTLTSRKVAMTYPMRILVLGIQKDIPGSTEEYYAVYFASIQALCRKKSFGLIPTGTDILLSSRRAK